MKTSCKNCFSARLRSGSLIDTGFVGFLFLSKRSLFLSNLVVYSGFLKPSKLLFLICKTCHLAAFQPFLLESYIASTYEYLPIFPFPLEFLHEISNEPSQSCFFLVKSTSAFCFPSFTNSPIMFQYVIHLF